MRGMLKSVNVESPGDPRCVRHILLCFAHYDAAKPIGLGWLQATGALMSIEEAQQLIGDKDEVWFDYIHDRSIKVGFRGNVLMRYDLYDRDQGHGKAAKVIAALAQSTG
jgi:hypothetical protein